MNLRSLAIAATALAAFALPIAASASTVTVGTSTSIGTSNISGCLSSWSNSSDHYQTDSLSLSGSAQLVESVALDGTLGKHSVQGAGNGVIQGDASLAVTATQESGKDSSGTSFHGSENETSVTTGSAAYSSFAP